MTLTGVSASGIANAVNTPLATATARGITGNVTPVVGKIVQLSGVSASGVEGDVYNASWTEIDTDEDAQWVLINTV
jgi:hypothetical protein